MKSLTRSLLSLVSLYDYSPPFALTSDFLKEFLKKSYANEKGGGQQLIALAHNNKGRYKARNLI